MTAAVLRAAYLALLAAATCVSVGFGAVVVYYVAEAMLRGSP